MANIWLKKGGKFEFALTVDIFVQYLHIWGGGKWRVIESVLLLVDKIDTCTGC